MNLTITAAARTFARKAADKLQQDDAEDVKESLTVKYIVRLLRVAAWGILLAVRSVQSPQLTHLVYRKETLESIWVTARKPRCRIH
jgi:hypothetical protein